MEIMTIFEALKLISRLGYQIDKSSSFSYTNNLNASGTYKARSLYLVQKDDKVSAFNVDARRDENFKKLQEFRRNVIVKSPRGIIWEF